MKAGRKILSLLLAVCMLICMLPTAVFAASNDDYMKVAMLDSGRKYFTVDWVKSFIYEAKADGYTHVMLAVGNDGMRFLLDDMSLTVNSKTYSSGAVKSAIQAGNTSYTSASTGEWSESEMDEIFAAANAAGIEIIPLLNSPGHMDAVLSAASSLTGVTCSYNSSVRTIDVTNTTAVAFTQAFIQKYIDYFAGKGCKYFNFGADEYANDRYTSGGMGFGNLQSSNQYGYFIKYVNELSAMVKKAGMTPIAFNDGIEYGNKTSASVGSKTYTFDKDIVVCYWSGGWSGYTLRTAANLASDGFKIINTTGDFYYVLGKNDNFDSSYTYASNWSNNKVCGTTLSSSSVIGGMFCLWSDYPGAETETQEAKKIRLPMRAMGLAMDGSYTYNLDQSVVAGGFNADGTLNTDPPAQVHNYEVTATKAATCTEPGSVTYTCTDCGDSYTETVAALGHDYTAEDDGGDTVYTCTRCGDTYSELLPRENVALKVGQTSDVYALEGEQTIAYAGDASIAKANLNSIQGTGSKVSYSATASASASGYTDWGYNCVASNLIDGSTDTYYWSTSSQTYGMYARVDLGAEVRFDAVQVSSPAHGDYCTRANVQVSSDGRTWTTIGTYTGSRSTAVTSTYEVPTSVESFRYIQVVITTARNYWWQLSEIAWGSYDGSTFTRAAASGTVQTGTEANTELSFTGVAAGTTAYVVDGTKYVVTVEASHEHSYEKTAESAPSCTEDGSITYTCTECGDSYTETVPATGHSYTSAVTAPTCTKNGYTTYICTVCGDSYVGDTVAALDHDYKMTMVAATCTKDGSKTYTCKRCGDSYTETIPENGHTYQTTVSEATCTRGGVTTYVCTACGDTYTETTEALGHDYDAVVTAPTCTEDGYTTYTCKRCGESYVDDAVEALGHDYTDVVTEPTCTEGGYTTHTCTRCGDSYVGSTVAALGHDYTDVVTEPTCTEDGYTTHTCTRCGNSYVDDAVEALGHDYTDVVTEPTCTEDGYTTHTCTRCGDSYTDSTVAALGHDYECTDDGDNLVYTCTRCGDSYTEEKMPTVTVNLQVGETYSFTTEDATVSEDIDTTVATMDVTTNRGGYQQVSELTEGKYLLMMDGYLLTTNTSYHYSSWDGAGYINGLTGAAYRSGSDFSESLWTIAEADGGYTIQSSDGTYLSITAGYSSSSVTLTNEPQVLTITELGDAFAISYNGVYLDRYSSAFIAAYPGNANENEQWQLYKAEPDTYDVTFTAVAGGKTGPVIGGTRYAIDVHAHAYTEKVTKAATCTENGVRTYTCSCGDTYTEDIPATGHSYICTETDDSYVYICENCGDTYTEEKLPTVEVNLQVGETYTFTTADATITKAIDTAVASMKVTTVKGGYRQVSALEDGQYLLVSGGRMLTPTSSTYYSSWDRAGTIKGLSCTNFNASGSNDASLWTITAVDGGYTVQSASGKYLNMTAGTRSSNVTLSNTPQVITINDLGETFSLQYSNVYLDRYSTSFAAAYPGNANQNEQWQLYKAESDTYQVTITAAATGTTRPVVGGTRYAVTVR